MEAIWDVLRRCGLAAPCSIHLNGPFQLDEPALRFVLSHLGFTLVDKPELAAAAVVNGRAAAERAGVGLQFSEEELGAPLLDAAGRVFPLLAFGPDGDRRRENIEQLLLSQEDSRIQLGAKLLRTGGVAMPLVSSLLMSWYCRMVEGRQEMAQMLEGMLLRWLPPTARHLLQEAYHLLFRLESLRRILPAFEPLPFCRQLEQHVAFFQSDWQQPYALFYADERESRIRAWNVLCGGGRLELSQGVAYLLENQSFEEYQGRPIRNLVLDKVNDVRPLRSFLGFSNRIFREVRYLQIIDCAEEAIALAGPHLWGKLRLVCTIRGSSDFYSLLPILRNAEVEHLWLSGYAPLQESHFNFAGMEAEPELARRFRGIGVTGFSSLQLDGLEAMRNLHTLSLKRNNLHHLPDKLGRLRRLRALYLSDNALARLPDSLFGLPLDTLSLENNPLHSDTREQVQKAFRPGVARME